MLQGDSHELVTSSMHDEHLENRLPGRALTFWAGNAVNNFAKMWTLSLKNIGCSSGLKYFSAEARCKRSSTCCSPLLTESSDQTQSKMLQKVSCWHRL